MIEKSLENLLEQIINIQEEMCLSLNLKKSLMIILHIFLNGLRNVKKYLALICKDMGKKECMLFQQKDSYPFGLKNIQNLKNEIFKNPSKDHQKITDLIDKFSGKVSGESIIEKNQIEIKEIFEQENIEEIFSIGLNRAITLIAEAKPGRMSSSMIKDLGEHPEDKKSVRIMKGQYGPYIKYKSLNATIPEEKDPTELTMEEALILIEKRKEYDKTKKKKRKMKNVIFIVILFSLSFTSHSFSNETDCNEFKNFQ